MKKIIRFKNIGSTHEYAKQNAEKFADFTVITAGSQSSGRGQFERKWHSPAGGLYFSLVLKPKKNKPCDVPLVTFAMALSVSDALKKYSGLKPELKWPNDVMVNEGRGKWKEGSLPAGRQEGRGEWKKIAGILTDSALSKNEIEWVVISAGVNANNQISRQLKGKAASVLGLLGRRVGLKKLLEGILTRFKSYYAGFPRLDIAAGYSARSMLLGKKISFVSAGKKYSGTVAGFDASGAIKLAISNRTVKIFHSGTVSDGV